MQFDRGKAPTCLLVLSIALICTGLAIAADDYPVRFERPARVGQRFQQSGRVEVHKRIVAALGGEPEDLVDELKFAVVYDITCEVLEVGKEGGPTAIETVITKMAKERPKGEQPLQNKGVIFHSRLNNGKTTHQPVFGKDRRPVPAKLAMEVQVALDNIISLRADGEHGADDRLGTVGRKKVGDSWPVNADAIQKALKMAGRMVDAKDITGDVKLAAVAPRGAVECAEFHAAIRIDNVPVPKDEHPPETTRSKGIVTLKSTTWIPLDQGQPTSASEVEQAITQHFEVTHGTVRNELSIKTSATYAAAK